VSKTGKASNLGRERVGRKDRSAGRSRNKGDINIHLKSKGNEQTGVDVNGANADEKKTHFATLGQERKHSEREGGRGKRALR